jgi:hypothetical protein
MTPPTLTRWVHSQEAFPVPSSRFVAVNTRRASDPLVSLFTGFGLGAPDEELSDFLPSELPRDL